jgi:hypothetical protein
MKHALGCHSDVRVWFLALVAPPGKRRCCLRTGKKAMSVRHAIATGRNALPPTVPFLPTAVARGVPHPVHRNAKQIPADSDAIPLPAHNTCACRGAPPAPWTMVSEVGASVHTTGVVCSWGIAFKHVHTYIHVYVCVCACSRGMPRRFSCA